MPRQIGCNVAWLVCNVQRVALEYIWGLTLLGRSREEGRLEAITKTKQCQVTDRSRSEEYSSIVRVSLEI